MTDPTDPSTLARERELCPHCAAPLRACPSCHGQGVLIEFQNVGYPCDACRWSGDVCPNPACGGSAQTQKESKHAQG